MRSLNKKKYIILSFALVINSLFTVNTFSQNHKPFQGKLVYSVEMADTAMQKMIPARTMVIYTNDTIVRIENETNQLGKQIIIKHTVLNKSILLLSSGDKNYAIQTNLNKKSDSTSLKPSESKYIYKKKFGRKKIVNKKANRMTIQLKGQKKQIEILYFKDYSTKYIDAYNEIPGLPVRYYIQTEDGIVVYTLIQMENKTINRDLFGIPSDYKRVTFDQFLDEVIIPSQK
jgi:hypothetical protein